MTVGGVDTYYDYEEQQWKSRRLGGGPIRRGPVCPAPRTAEHPPVERTHGREHDTREGADRSA
ncbi:MAG TPA: hypothetical protein VFT31_06640 [Kribbella sp.]|nr:hypothetical protein [Kribbella sp.]